LRAVDRALGAVDIQDQTPRERAGRVVLYQVRIEARDFIFWINATLPYLRHFLTHH
jgi:hypothetical protein